MRVTWGLRVARWERRVVLVGGAMSRQSPFVIELSVEDRRRLESVVRRRTAEQRKRFFEEGIDGLADRKRSGRPRTFPPSGHR